MTEDEMRQIKRLQQRAETAEGHIAVLEAQVRGLEAAQRAREPQREPVTVTVTQASTGSVDWSDDPDHSPEAIDAITRGDWPALNAIRQRAAGEAAERAAARQVRQRKFWDVGNRAYYSDSAVSEQRSTHPAGSFWSQFPEHAPAEDPARVAAALEQHEAWKAGMLRQDAAAEAGR